MASSTLRPHRSPSPSPVPSPTINPSNPAKLTRQSLGPPSTTQGASAKGFAGLGISSPTGAAHPRHVSSAAMMGGGSGSNGIQRENSLSPRPSLGSGTTLQHPRAVSHGPGFALGMMGGQRPSSEYIPNRENSKTPEAEQIDQWFKHLASWEATLEEMAAASTDQNFTEELGAIEQWFRVLSEAERTAALYSLLQHSTPVQIRFFLSVLHHMAQSDPMTALLSPAPSGPGLQAQMEQKLNAMNLKSPSAGGGSGFTGSPNPNQYLAPDDAAAQKAKAKQNRISAPGTLQPLDRWQSGLDQVIERGSSPGLDSNGGSSRSKSPVPGARPKSTDFSGQANQPRRESGDNFNRSPRLSAGGVGLGIGQPEGLPHGQSPVTSPFLNNGSWASMVNTPMVPGFIDPKVDNLTQALNMANLGLANPNRIPLEDARKFRRPGAGGTASRNVSGAYNDDGEMVNPRSAQPGSASGFNATSPLMGGAGFVRSPVLDQFSGLGLGADPNALAGLGMNFSNLGGLGGVTAAQLMAMQQLQTAASFQQGGYGGSPNLGVGAFGGPQYGNNRGGRNGNAGGPPGRKSPMLGGGNSAKGSPAPGAAGGGGGAGGGAGVAGPDDVEMKILEDTPGWLRVLRLHKYTPNFEKVSWKDMVQMNDQDLQDKGISAQGARTKFLKVFYNVRTKLDIPHPEGQEEYAPGAKDK
ncbi:uncharacterized protein I303_101383 [Kwoniella dejecticola CBS 10117]|uniref:RNA-binding protein VTS1 n=1 Tax=Kwoniella dejecticola CBS 10117 TaxID=1296121 RepID=A0A1A6AHM4_9TREE|nr:RNA binding protein [Kwoniella dejecticola CBS 10117]OBR89564.1 RNA binding protein [Kwoniella dejecticola CBS 10117]